MRGARDLRRGERVARALRLLAARGGLRQGRGVSD